MYCPNCGVQNIDANKHCRGCGEDLQLISQALKRRLPVLLAGKIESLLSKKSEIYRRNSIVAFIMGGALLTAGLGKLLRGEEVDWMFFSFAGISFLISIWIYLAYRYCLSLGREYERGGWFPQGEESFTGASDPLPKKAVGEVRFLHCPACSAPFSNRTKYCLQCGANLEAIQKATKQSLLRSTLDSLLARYVKGIDKSMAKRFAGKHMSKWMLLLSIAYIALLFVAKYVLGRSFAILPFTMVFVFFFWALWDYMVSRRLHSDIDKGAPLNVLPDLHVEQPEPHAPTTKKLPDPASSMAEVTTKKLGDKIEIE